MKDTIIKLLWWYTQKEVELLTKQNESKIYVFKYRIYDWRRWLRHKCSEDDTVKKCHKHILNIISNF